MDKTLFLEFTMLFIVAWVTLYVGRKGARLVGLVDKPNERKHHDGAIPLVGGLSVGLTVIAFALYHSAQYPQTLVYVFCVAILLIVGVLDDRFDISFKSRLVVQALLSLIMINLAEIELHYLGNLFGFGGIELGWLGAVVTIVAVIGAINAFNMVDGIDGLLGGLSMVTFFSLSIALWLSGDTVLVYACMVFVVAMLPYVLFNLAIFGKKRKVFMGDAGSMVIGFSVVWLLLSSTQTAVHSLEPITVVWFIAIPLCDMASIMMRRIKRGDSPFKPDRDHLHHIFLRLNLSSRQTLAAICSIALMCSGFGLLGQLLDLPEYFMFGAFVLLFAAYHYTLSHVWVLTKRIRERLALRRRESLERDIA
ncbi:UDP-N-acetylglucosamine--undecaprenyl-phosphate N-acetylglucosaminephosphotransferase [Thaumasiovibrio sp. DFM-14]|uniref:UDP-N-acetylglucosamine--undecaprenyl-phosphate N-acetylglucosaminephosphotransferase n=1 Tax=Thaumasiovibrio sp. DFM-14 TaxID=3384792 RepID=UPI0039A2B675